MEDIRVFIKTNPAIILTGIYLYFSSLGFLRSYAFYNHFDIPITTFLESSDFFLSAFYAPPLILIATLLAICLVIILIFLEKHAHKIIVKIRYMIIAFCVTLILALVGAYNDGLRSTHGRMCDYVVGLKNQSTPIYAHLIGKKGKFIFLYDKKLNQVHIIPIDNINTITINNCPTQ